MAVSAIELINYPPGTIKAAVRLSVCSQRPSLVSVGVIAISPSLASTSPSFRKSFSKAVAAFGYVWKYPHKQVTNTLRLVGFLP